jgi:hypothetical protein
MFYVPLVDIQDPEQKKAKRGCATEPRNGDVPPVVNMDALQTSEHSDHNLS